VKDTFGYCEECGRFGYWSTLQQAYRCNVHWKDDPVQGLHGTVEATERMQDQLDKANDRIKELIDMVATVTPVDGINVIVVPDDDAEAKNVPPGILAMLGPSTVLMSNDSRRCYMRKTHWEGMKDSFKLVNK
jgi:hypothetical protein